MTNTHWHTDFIPAGCNSSVGAAVTADAGVQYWQLYKEAVEHNRLVMGGTCLTVGHVGAMLGGGYGDASRMYGPSAGTLVEAEVVLADGEVVVANKFNQYRDLF